MKTPIKTNVRFGLAVAAVIAGLGLPGCRSLEERQEDRTALLDRRQDRYDTRAEGFEERQRIRSERMDDRMDSRLDSW